MTLRQGTLTGLCMHTTGAYSDPKPQVGRYTTLTTTISGQSLVMSTDAPRANGIIKCTLNGSDLLDASLDHGRGIQYAWNCLPTGEVVSTNVYSPTEQGSQRDGASPALGSSKPIFHIAYADGKRHIRRGKPAMWMAPNQVTVPLHPALNSRLLSEFVTTVDTQLSYAGDDNIIAQFIDVVVPDIAEVTSKQILDMVSTSVYAKSSVFDGTVLYLTPSTGATRTYPGFPDTSNTEIILLSNAADTLAMAVYQPLGEWGATGYSQCYSPAGMNNMFVRAREVVGNIVPGVRRYNSFIVLTTGSGAKAAAAAKVQALDAQNITRNVNIEIPVLAA